MPRRVPRSGKVRDRPSVVLGTNDGFGPKARRRIALHNAGYLWSPKI